jgi:pyruvate dehydrogenase E2 component (dihydrolipoamide acetyltransferase)
MTDPLVPLPHKARGRRSPPLVLLHGFGGDRLAWNGIVAELSRLRRTIAVDLPGHGEAAGWPRTPDARACAEALCESLDGLGIARAVLVGHSMGGAVAGIVGLLRPDLVERLVLLAPGGFGPQMNVPLLRRYAAMTGEDEIVEVLSQFFAPGARLPEALPRLVAEQRRDARLRRSFAAIVEVLAKGEGQGTLPLEDLAAAPFPVSVVWGTEDRVVPVSQAVEAPAVFARHLLPGVGHMPHMEAPDTVTRILAQAVCGRTG